MLPAHPCGWPYGGCLQPESAIWVKQSSPDGAEKRKRDEEEGGKASAAKRLHPGPAQHTGKKKRDDGEEDESPASKR